MFWETREKTFFSVEGMLSLLSLNQFISFLLTHIERHAISILIENRCNSLASRVTSNYHSFSGSFIFSKRRDHSLREVSQGIQSLDSILKHPDFQLIFNSLRETSKSVTSRSMDENQRKSSYDLYDSPENILKTTIMKLTQENENLRRNLEAEKSRRKREETQMFVVVQTIKDVESDLDTNGVNTTSLTQSIRKLGRKLYSHMNNHDLSQAIIDIYSNQLRRETTRETGPLSLIMDYDQDVEIENAQSSVVEPKSNSTSSSSKKTLTFGPAVRGLHVVQEEEEGLPSVGRESVNGSVYNQSVMDEEEQTSRDVSEHELDDIPLHEETQTGSPQPISSPLSESSSVVRVLNSLVSRVDQMVRGVKSDEVTVELKECIELHETVQKSVQEKNTQTIESSDEIELLLQDIRELKNLLNLQALHLVEAQEKLLTLESASPKMESKVSRVEDELHAWKEMVDQQKILLERVIRDHEETQIQLSLVKKELQEAKETQIQLSLVKKELQETKEQLKLLEEKPERNDQINLNVNGCQNLGGPNGVQNLRMTHLMTPDQEMSEIRLDDSDDDIRSVISSLASNYSEDSNNPNNNLVVQRDVREMKLLLNELLNVMLVANESTNANETHPSLSFREIQPLIRQWEKCSRAAHLALNNSSR